MNWLIDFAINSPGPLLLAAALYVLQGIAYIHHGNIGLAIVFICYAIANCGFALDWYQFE
tara:strand:+ start:355 stop:534 length:180 start_codon:yes stop_codon:yes gene_type:complete